jgi:hypothetical protein
MFADNFKTAIIFVYSDFMIAFWFVVHCFGLHRLLKEEKNQFEHIVNFVHVVSLVQIL